MVRLPVSDVPQPFSIVTPGRRVPNCRLLIKVPRTRENGARMGRAGGRPALTSRGVTCLCRANELLRASVRHTDARLKRNIVEHRLNFPTNRALGWRGCNEAFSQKNGVCSIIRIWSQITSRFCGAGVPPAVESRRDACTTMGSYSSPSPYRVLVPTLRVGTAIFPTLSVRTGDAERRNQCVPTRSVETRAFFLSSNPVMMLQTQKNSSKGKIAGRRK